MTNVATTPAGKLTADPATFYPGRFTGRVILVTGAAGGLGSAAVDRLANEGATVVCTDVTGTGEGISREITALDVTDRAAWDTAVATIMATHGRLDGALFAHGIQGPESSITDMPFAGWSKTLSVNLDGCFHGLAAVLPVLASQGYGRIGILSSISAREGNPFQAAYSASKAAVVSLVKTAAKEVAAHNVTVNAIAPSMMQTRLLEDLSPERNAALLSRVPMGRVGTTAEFAALATWLLSTEASYVTGQTLDLSGGRNTA
ncbi:oxidoreductase (plasmid) [Rhodococcus erythropolis R138]|uniref:SDR family NAD(P)-dependent oxidoreductase n=1 Tax=Rhodococcus erythropolis TaxID=1833 RepID=UPI000689EDFD|nr:SDR family NAD(P)-dependent oxidoreductase [Rhodococcus erythropolis]ALU73426.1 oxidoreductase [Rhodococcus erythropolis R138]